MKPRRFWQKRIASCNLCSSVEKEVLCFAWNYDGKISGLQPGGGTAIFHGTKIQICNECLTNLFNLYEKIAPANKEHKLKEWNDPENSVNHDELKTEWLRLIW